MNDCTTPLWPDPSALGPVTDLYQLTMMAGYAAEGIDGEVPGAERVQSEAFSAFLLEVDGQGHDVAFDGVGILERNGLEVVRRGDHPPGRWGT